MDKNRMNQEFIDDIKAMFPPERVLIGEEISEDYGHDELGDVFSMPEILIKAVSTEEIANIMKYASGRDIPVVVRGAGTGLVGGAVATHGGIMIETTGMNHILELDRENLTVTVEPGVLLMELAEYVEGQGLFYPPDPGEKSATIGGQYQHKCRRNAGGKVWGHQGLCERADIGYSGRKYSGTGRQGGKKQFWIQSDEFDNRLRGNTGNYYKSHFKTFAASAKNSQSADTISIYF